MAKMPKSVRNFLYEREADLMRFILKRHDHIERGVIGKANLPSDYQKRTDIANRCAKSHAQRNRSDPFAAMRARSAVMNGWLDEQDFNAGAISV